MSLLSAGLIRHAFSPRSIGLTKTVERAQAAIGMQPASKKARLGDSDPARQTGGPVLRGFQTAESLGCWPTEILGTLFGTVSEDDLEVRKAFLRRRRTEALLQDGVVLHTDYSGKGSVEAALRILDIAGKDMGGGAGAWPRVLKLARKGVAACASLRVARFRD